MSAIADKKMNPAILNQIIKNSPELISFLRENDLVEAALLQKTPRALYFDLGKFGSGVVCGYELTNARNIAKELQIGQSINAKVVNRENEDGYVELSLAGAHKQKNWQEIKELKEANEVLTVKIIGANSGGLMAEINKIKAFLPVSQLASEHYPRVNDGDKTKILEELKKLIDLEINVKIIDFNPRNDKLIISEKEAAQENIKELISKYKEGDVIDGIVSGAADFGVFVRFVDNPAIEGMIHISELDHRLIDNPKEAVKVDEAIKAKIIEIKDGQVFLSLKALKPNPWETAAEKFKEGQEIKGVVYKFNPFGAYINLDHELQGMIHVSEFGGVEEMKKQLEQGKTYNFTIESLKPEEKKILLKFKK